MNEFVPVLVENDAPVARPGPGGRLQAARLERQLDVESIATALRVAPRLIAAMEGDRFNEFDAAVYARGLLRSYARFLNLPVDEVLAAYEDVAGGAPPPTLLPPASAGPLPRDYSTLIKAGVLLLTLLLVCASFWWWLGRVAPPELPVAASVAPSAAMPADGDGAADGAADFVSPAPESLTLGGTPDANASNPSPAAAVSAPPSGVAARIVTPAPAPLTPVAAQPLVLAKPVATPAKASGPAPAPSAAFGTTGAIPHPSVVTAAAASAAPQAATPIPKPAPLVGQPPPALTVPVAGGPQIVLRGKQDCWVEVRAAGGARLFYGLVRPGETHTMPGPAPWFIYLGYADGVELSVAGHVVDVPASRREGARARFGVAADGTLR